MRHTRRIRGLRSGDPLRGFSAVELLLVIAVIAVVATIVVPMLDVAGRSRLPAAAEVLVSDLAYAQSESMVHGDDPRMVVFDLAGDSYRIATSSDPSVPIANPADGSPYLVRYGAGRVASLAGVTITDVALGGDDRLVFGTLGETDQTTPARVTLASDGLALTVTIDAETGEAVIGQIR